MKQYEEMAKDVLRRIEEYKDQQQRKKKKLVRALVPVMCGCLVALVGVGIWQAGLSDTDFPGAGQMESPQAATQEQTTAPSAGEESTAPPMTDGVEPVLPIKPFITLCGQEKSGDQKMEVIELNRTYETGIYLDFVSIDGFTEDQIQQKIQECEKNFRDILSQFESIEYGSHYGVLVLREEGYLVARMTWNFFTLDLDLTTVKKIEIKNTAKYGQIDVFGVDYDPQTELFPHGQTITIEKEQIREGISFSWSYERLNHYMQETDNPTSADFNDTFCFVVEFDDGTMATATVDITFDATGRASVCCREYERIL